MGYKAMCPWLKSAFASVRQALSLLSYHTLQVMHGILNNREVQNTVLIEHSWVVFNYWSLWVHEVQDFIEPGRHLLDYVIL